MNANPIGWVEIPVSDITRAIKFYNSVFNYNLKAEDLGALQMAQFPFDHSKSGCAGALVYNQEFYNPDNSKGPLVYFECENVKETLERIGNNGGKILIEERLISQDYGYMGVGLDTEGNRIALHASSKT